MHPEGKGYSVVYSAALMLGELSGSVKQRMNKRMMEPFRFIHLL